MDSKKTGITKLKVVWSGAGVCPELERALWELLAEFGLECWAQGYDYEAEERDLAFRPASQKDRAQ